MYTKKFFIAVFIVFVVNSILNYLLHAIILPWEIFPVSFWPWEMYPGLINFKNTSLVGMLTIFFGNFVYSYFFCLIFVRGKEWGGIIRGMRYGLKIGVFFYFTLFLYHFASLHYPPILLWGELIGGVLLTIIMGIALVIAYKPEVER